MARKQALTRRGFLKRAGAGLAAPYILTSTALGAPGTKPASDRIIAGAIGVGGRGTGLLAMNRDPRCSIVAVCDVDKARMARGQRVVGGKCEGYQDFRRIIDRNDIDAVMTGTPDHWHALITVMACESGKDVYCEKPLCRTIYEGQKMVEAARRYHRVVQMGTQYRSIGSSRQACEWIRSGRLGTVGEVHMTHAPNRFCKRGPSMAPPANLDWNMWLGPAPYAPYHPRRCHFSFRYFMDYGGGYIADNGAHMFSIVSWAMGIDETGPVTIEATGREDPENLYDVPVDLHVRYEFDNPKFVLTWTQAKGTGLNLKFVGANATLDGFWGFRVTKGQADLSPTLPDEVHLYESNNHYSNWMECIATRKHPVCDVAIGHRVTSLSHLGNIAYLTGRKLRWDPAREEFIGDDVANGLRHMAYRAPWRL